MGEGDLFVPPEFMAVCTDELKRALLGAYRLHGLLSTRKAVAALRFNPRIAQALDSMNDTERIPMNQNSVPIATSETELLSTLQRRILMREVKLLCSPCVYTACHTCLERFGSRDGALVDEETFLLVLIEQSKGPTAQRWKSDGYNPERFETMIRTEGCEGSRARGWWRGNEDGRSEYGSEYGRRGGGEGGFRE